jgi:hypothetical protein
MFDLILTIAILVLVLAALGIVIFGGRKKE